MLAATLWEDDDPYDSSQPTHPSRSSRPNLAPGELPNHVAAALWRGSDLGSTTQEVVSAGWPELDRELPGGGWPCGAVTEVLQPLSMVCEWRLLGHAIGAMSAADKTVVLIGPPMAPHPPGLKHVGLDARHIIWVKVETPAQRLWVTEAAIKSNAAGAVVSWLPQAQPEQIRRLQVAAQACQSLVFLLRPEAAKQEASAAPLRIQLRFALDWKLQVHILKRKGATHDGMLALPSVPGGLSAVLTPRLLKPSSFFSSRLERGAATHALGSLASAVSDHRRIATH